MIRRDDPVLEPALMFTLRFDMRLSEGGATDLYAAAIDMCAWPYLERAVMATERA